MAGFVGLILSLFLCTTAIAGGSISVGADVLHEPGQPVIIGQYNSIVVIHWGTNYGLGHSGVAYGKVWQVGLGGIVVAHRDELVGTNLNFLPWAKYCPSSYCFAFTHISHGAVFGIAPDRPNGGMNFLAIEVPFRR